MRTALGIALLTLVLLFGCAPAEETVGEASEPESQSEAASAEPDRVVAWSCGDDAILVTEFYGASEHVVLRRPDGDLELPRVEAASGAKYSDGSVTFWAEGDEAVYAPSDGESRDCAVDRYRTDLEAAKLAGYQFRAVGNEPGWMLLIGRDRILWETDYGEARYEIAAPEPVSPDETSTVWQTEIDERSWTLTLSEGPCFDDMSGAQFDTKVQIDFGDRTYRGCGQPLR